MKRRHKYNAVRTVVDGIAFASKAEARRYGELKLREQAGEISNILLQPKYELHAPGVGENIPIGIYRADFEYWDKVLKRRIVEDVKGVRTPIYRWKCRHVEAQYGITVVEI